MRLATVLALAASLLAPWAVIAAPATTAAECGKHLRAPARQLAQGKAYALAFAPSRWPIEVGQHFQLQFELCPLAGAPLPAGVKVDAEMPLHKYGMNYRATVKPLGQGRYTADGLMFHMPGKWRFVFELTGVTPADRLSADVDVP